MNDILVPYMKEVFKLDYSQASLIQFCFFGAYGIASIPASKLIERYGYKKGMISGFLLAAIGCGLFYPAVYNHTYEVFLGSLFVLATGIVLLQISANPFVGILGPRDTASSRLTMVQAFNSFGTFLAPFFGAFLILSKMNDPNSLGAVKLPYLLLSIILLLIAGSLYRFKYPSLNIKDPESRSWSSIAKEPNVLLGMFGIFAYVGAEVAIGSFLVNYVMERLNSQEIEAAHTVALYWGGAMVGRFLGIFTLKEFSPGKVLSFHALLAIALILISINSYGMRAVYAIVLVGVCNSIMFPTIYSLATKKLDEHQLSRASGLLGTAIVGGAIIPFLTGSIADEFGLRVAFLFPASCYLYIVAFGMSRNNRERLLN